VQGLRKMLTVKVGQEPAVCVTQVVEKGASCDKIGRAGDREKLAGCPSKSRGRGKGPRSGKVGQRGTAVWGLETNMPC